MISKRLIVDTNILISALIKKSITQHLILKSSLQLLAPEFLLEEIEDKKRLIVEKSNLSIEEITNLLDDLLEYIEIIPFYLIDNCIDEAFDLIGAKDPKDILYLASYLCINVGGICSNDKDFKIDKYPVFNTSDILRDFNLTYI